VNYELIVIQFSDPFLYIISTGLYYGCVKFGGYKLIVSCNF